MPRENVENHSSALFNQRVDRLIQVLNEVDYQANNSIPLTVQHIIAYYSALRIFYEETSQAFDKNENKGFKDHIDGLLKKTYNDIHKIKVTQQATNNEIYEILTNCNLLRHLMQTGLHNVSYFFRFGKSEPKSIADTLKMFGQK